MVVEDSKLYSWVDVKNELMRIREHGLWPEGIKAEIYGSGLYIYFTGQKTKEAILDWLREIFPAAISVGVEAIRLENIQEEARYLPIITERVQKITDEYFNAGFALSSEVATKAQIPTLNDYKGRKPVIIAAHSFKGGVGRTMHALGLAAAIERSEPEARILFVDADFEAPGTTWLTQDAEISLADVLHLVHSSEDPMEVIPFLNASILNQQIGNIYFLPAFRTERQMINLEIRPEHIFKFSDNPFILTDVFAELSGKLGSDYVIIDLRAGISELSANWLLDPRVAKLLVTTLNSQSVEGTRILLNLLAERQLRHGVSFDPPILAVSQVSRDTLGSLEKIWKKSEEPSSFTAAQNIHYLREAYENYLLKIETLNTLDEEKAIRMDELPLVLSPHDERLLVLSNDWNSLKKLMEKSGFQDRLNDLAAYFSIGLPIAKDMLNNLPDSRQKMFDVLPNLIYAERHLPDHFYLSNAIRSLALKNRTRIPNLVVIGAKGSGKTFLFRQLLRIGNWKEFVSKFLLSGDQIIPQDSEIVAITYPQQVEAIPSVWVEKVKPCIVQMLNEDLNLTQWRNVWLDVMAWSCGHEIGIEGAGTRFLASLSDAAKSYLFIFDGLEDLFQNYFDNQQEQIALKALLQDVTSYVNAVPNSTIGVMPFIRKDILEHVIKQNLGQFVDRYKDYELKWDRTEALRLVVWIMDHYKIYPLPDLGSQNILNAGEEQLTGVLNPLWGRKLGADQSREARSAKKILNILSNFNDEVQSRDLVRFLAEAVKKENGSSTHPDDRLLSPKAIRDAFPEVGKAKLDEVKQENQGNPYGKVLQKLKDRASDLRLPAEQIDFLSNEEISLLEEQGVLIRYDNRYYMTELFRLGIGIDRGKGKVRTTF